MRTVPRIQYEHPDKGDNPRPDAKKVGDLEIGMKAERIINQHYPGHFWVVKIDSVQGYLMIKIPLLMGMTNWYFIPLDLLATDPGMKRVIRGCGEILERYNMPRSALREADFLNAVDLIPPHLRGTHGQIPS